MSASSSATAMATGLPGASAALPQYFFGNMIPVMVANANVDVHSADNETIIPVVKINNPVADATIDAVSAPAPGPVVVMRASSGASRNTGLLSQTTTAVSNKLAQIKASFKNLASMLPGFPASWYINSPRLSEAQPNRELVASMETQTSEMVKRAESAEASASFCSMDLPIFVDHSIHEMSDSLNALERALASPPNPALAAMIRDRKAHEKYALSLLSQLDAARDNSSLSNSPSNGTAPVYSLSNGTAPAGTHLFRRDRTRIQDSAEYNLDQEGRNFYCNDRHRYKCRQEHLCPEVADEAEYFPEGTFHPEHGHVDSHGRCTSSNGHHCEVAEVHGRHEEDTCVANCKPCKEVEEETHDDAEDHSDEDADEHDDVDHEESEEDREDREDREQDEHSCDDGRDDEEDDEEEERRPSKRPEVQTHHHFHETQPKSFPKFKAPLTNDNGEEIFNPMPHKPRDGSIELWSQRAYRGHKVVYGKIPNRCHTVSTYTHGHIGFGKSARIRKEGHSCLLFTGRGCSGYSTYINGSIPSLAPYDLDNRVKSVLCMDEEGADRYFAEELWRSQHE